MTSLLPASAPAAPEAIVPEPAQIGFEEGAQIGDAVFQHGDAVEAHAEGPALDLVRVHAAGADDIGMHHAGAQNLQPLVAGADLQLPAFAASSGCRLPSTAR